MQDDYDKLKLELQSSEKSIAGIIEQMSELISSIDREITTFNVSLSTVADKYKSLETNSQDLETSLASFKKEHQDLSQQVENKSSEVKELRERLNLLETETSNLESTKLQKTQEISQTETAIKQFNEEIVSIEQRLEGAENIYQERVATIEQEIDGINTQTSNKNNQYKILRQLLAENYIADSRYEVIKFIKQPGMDSRDKLIMTSGVGRETVEETLTYLGDKGVINYDAGGSFSINKDFEI